MKKCMIIIFISEMIFIVGSCGFQGNEETKTTSASAETKTETVTETMSETKTNVKTLSILDYFPLESDIYMRYSGLGNEYAEYQTYVEYIDNGRIQLRKINPGTSVALVYSIEDGMLIQVYSKGESYYRQNRIGLSEKKDILIKEPIEIGNSWTSSDGYERKITAVDTTVEVPFGTFQAVEITTIGKNSVDKEYYAAGIGLIKSLYIMNDDIDSTISSNLESVERGRPFIQDVRFYYPDFNNERLVYVHQNIELFTGDDVVDIMEEQFKYAPKNTDLQALMSKNTSIHEISYDEETQIATIDFSSEFLTEMNAGAYFESIILGSVADTLGCYFGTNKVIITIEGANYSSGHFYFEKGEYMMADWENVLEYQIR